MNWTSVPYDTQQDD